MNLAYLSLGSNIDPARHLKAAITLVKQQTWFISVSSVWETLPIGLSEQPNFLNAAALTKTPLNADQLKTQVLQPIEQQLGRIHQINKYGPRTIDIDIVLFNQEILDLGTRHIPDPEILERPFVAIPLAELVPNYIHPETGQQLKEIAEQFGLNREDMWPRTDVVLG